MFNPKSNRVNYGDLLLPPDGCTLLRGIGTTYSLDFETLTAICIALGINDETDGISSQSPVCMLHSIEKVANKIVIFHEGGQAIAPKQASPLFLLLEKILVPVSLATKTNGFFNSFHAKCWILEYENKSNEKIFRFIIMSRNMTTDRSWDVVASFDGRRSRERSENADALRDFVKYLKDSHIKNNQSYCKKNREILDGLYKDLDRVNFEYDLWGNGKPFVEMDILPIYEGRSILDPLVERYHDKVIITPFLSADILDKLSEQPPYAGGSDRRILITRASELKKVEPLSDRFDVYIIKEQILNGESAEGAGTAQVLDIHAKMYLIRQYSWSWLYLGSMNASDGCTGGNVEMMVALCAANRYLNGTTLLNQIFDSDDWTAPNNPFEKVEFPLPEENSDNSEDEQRQLMQAIKLVCRQPLSARVSKDADSFSAKISCAKGIEGCSIYLKPLRRVDYELELQDEMVFSGLALTDLSEFYIICARTDTHSISKVIMIPTVGIPEERDKKIISSIINSRQAFLDYVCYVLGGGSVTNLLNLNYSGWDGESAQSQARPMFSTPALFEMMLKTAATDSERLREIEHVMNRLADEVETDNPEQKIVTEEFRTLYDTFAKATKLKKR